MTPPACTCDGGFRWADDRWARQQAGIGRDDTEHTPTPASGKPATLNTAVPCTDCSRSEPRGYVR